MKESFRLFRVAGIDVSIHWTWFLVAAFQIEYRRSEYHSPVWIVAEYLTLFLIVLLHEFGHALACRQTGGKSDHITLWPLGGIAYVQPPPRPGALLWSIAAGPLVNVVLVPITWGLYLYLGWARNDMGPGQYLFMVAWINLGLLIFNILPIYPLDGGQILQALLWFILGRVRSLLVACWIGMAGGVAMVGGALYRQSIWFGVLALFVVQQCWLGLKVAKQLAEYEKLSRHSGFACPECGEAPFQAEKWKCSCGASFDPFATDGVCPQCQKKEDQVQCYACRETSDLQRWRKG